MAAFKTRFGEPIMRVLNAYPTQGQTVAALEILIETALAKKVTDSVADLAAKTCRGLHADAPGTGVICEKCFEAAGAQSASGPADVAPVLSETDEDFVKSLVE